MASEPPTTAATATSHIPSFAKPLAPYVKSRQEALRIRQVLTSYLRSHIAFTGDDPDRPSPHAESHVALCPPQDAVVDVKRIQSEFTGLRREYLEALQANVAARKEYQSVSGDVTAKTNAKRKPKADTVASDPASGLQGYLVLIRDRRRHAKLQVFQHYLQELKTRRAPEPDHFDKTEEQNQQLQHIEEIQDGGQSSSGGGVEGLVHKLERAVIRARAQLDRERKLFEELKSQHNSESKQSIVDTSPAVKIQALKRTRDTLVLWVEEKLMSVGSHDDAPMEDLSPDEIEHAATLLEERKVQTTGQYAAYVEARRALLESASKACQPVTAGPAKPQQASLNNDKSIPQELPPLEPMGVLSFASELLLPLSKSQRALALQKSYLSGMLSKEKSTTLRILNRLSDESHLLPEYPVLARQPRFKHGVAAINTRNSMGPREQIPPDEITTLPEAWAFASGAARDHEQEYVAQKVVEGGETLNEALQTLEEMCGTLNQDLQEIFPDGQDQETKNGPEIWTSEAQKKSNRVDKRPKGPWNGLNGRVGIAE